MRMLCSSRPFGSRSRVSADWPGASDPGEAVGAGDGDDAAVAEVDDRAARGEHPLLGYRVAVVRRDRGDGGIVGDGVGGTRTRHRDGTGQGQQGRELRHRG